MIQEDRYTDPYQCMHCGNTAPMLTKGHQSTVLKESPDQQYQWLQIHELLECSVCRRPTLRAYTWLEPDGDPESVVFRQLYPAGSEVPNSLPDEIKRAYLAAEKIKCLDANSYGVLVGRVIELIATDKGSKKKRIDTALKDLQSKKIIPDSIYTIAMKLMDLRNVGGHAWLGTLTESEVPILSELCEAIVFHVYVVPSLTEKANAAISQLRALDRKKKKRGQSGHPD